MIDFKEHLQRVSDNALNVFQLDNLSRWIEKHTKLDGKPWSFKDHEYQRDIIDDPSKEVYVAKCAQVGLSEIFARWGMAAVATQENFTLIWTFPSTTDAEKFAKTRLDPFIQSSPELRRSVSNSVNSAELKQFNANSFAYIRGTLSETGGLSVPADLLIHDELDKSDMANISTYVSRLQHKPTKMRRLFSTPTIKKYGISLLSETSRRKRQMWKCSHCNHHFLPTFEHDIHVPGWDRPKREIDKVNIKDVRWEEAQLLCPKCFKVPDRDVKYREWVIENTQDKYEAVTYFVTPFCAPAIITPPYLVNAVARFSKWSEYQNQVLGLTAEDDEEVLTDIDMRKCLINAPLDSSEMHYMGVDLGITCHIMIGRRDRMGNLLVVHREKVLYTKLEDRRRELCSQYRISVSVLDMYPYTDIVNRITQFEPNAYGAQYVETRSSEVFTMKEEEEDPEKAKISFRCVKINRNPAFDQLMNEIKEGRVVLPAGDDFDTIVAHCTDQKRVQVFDRYGGIIYKWQKTSGNDHYHHALLYLHIACLLRSTVQPVGPMGMNLISTFKRRN